MGSRMGNSQSSQNAHEKKKGLKPLAAIGIIAAILLLSLATYAGWTRFNISVTAHEAMEIALSHVGGGVAATPEMDWEVWRWLWWVEVWYGNLVYEIYIHPNTGEIIRVEIERD